MKETSSKLSRIVLAGLLAPAVGIMAIVGAITGLGMTQGELSLEDTSGLGHGIFFFLFFGLPPAWIVECAVGLVAFRFLSAKGMLHWKAVLLTAGISGAILFWVAMLAFFPAAREDPWASLLLGALGGVISGFVLWIGALRRVASERTRV